MPVSGLGICGSRCSGGTGGADPYWLLDVTYAWLYKRRLIAPRERDLRRLVLLAIEWQEHAFAARIRRKVRPLVPAK